MADHNNDVKRVQGAGKLVWVDLEMTGLDVEHDVIVQAALIITDDQLNALETYTVDVWQPDHVLARMTPFVRDMHENTGLLPRVRASKVDLREAERRMLSVIAGWCAHPATLAGSSVGYDKRFLERYMPAVAGYLHYRALDVSVLKIISSLWYGSATRYEKSKAGEHDALVDIRHSIAELKHYRGTLLR